MWIKSVCNLVGLAIVHFQWCQFMAFEWNINGFVADVLCTIIFNDEIIILILQWFFIENDRIPVSDSSSVWVSRTRKIIAQNILYSTHYNK